MLVLRAFFSPSYWRHGFSVAKALAALLSSFGALWLAVEVATYFAPDSEENLRNLWPLFLSLGFVAAAWINRPIHAVSCKLGGRDISITVAVGDLFSFQGAVVIGSNTSFDTDIQSGLISKNSVQGQFTRKFYDSVSHFDSDIEASLSTIPSSAASAGKKGKQQVFTIGTVAQVSPRGQMAYLLAIAHITAKGVANGTFDELKTALPRLWEHIASAGTIDPIVLPVLGSGFSRLPEPREEIVREIISSFVAACAERRFTEGLTVAMHPRDFYRHSVDLPQLERYLQHICRYTQYGLAGQAGTGRPAI